eukprot:793085-Pleurochrysis_carterae.AAC.2
MGMPVCLGKELGKYLGSLRLAFAAMVSAVRSPTFTCACAREGSTLRSMASMRRRGHGSTTAMIGSGPRRSRLRPTGRARSGDQTLVARSQFSSGQPREAILRRTQPLFCICALHERDLVHRSATFGSLFAQSGNSASVCIATSCPGV